MTSPQQTPTRWRSGLPETVCGRGSTLKATTLIRGLLPQLVEEYNIRTVADVGAGDMNWAASVYWDVEYDPYDIDPVDDRLQQFNIVEQVLPKVYDLVMCMYVMNHFPVDGDVTRALNNIKRSQAFYLLATFLRSKEDGTHELQEMGEPLRQWYHKENARFECFYGLWELRNA